MTRIALLLAAILLPTGVALAAVDVNTATKAELESEGIGSAAAQAIIDYRAKNGPFKSADEVHRVVSDAIAAKMNIGISISGPATAKSAAPKEKPADTAAVQVPDAKSKPRDDREFDSVRDQKRKDSDDRKT